MPIRTGNNYHRDDCPLFEDASAGEHVDSIPPGDGYCECPLCA